MKKAKELTFEHQAALYIQPVDYRGMPTFEPKTVKVDSLGDFTQAVIDVHKDLENLTLNPD